ncbi:hypothetical protein [Pseudovibrio exalbescens]|uniref:hypothetical protein n=1 Tax=Pseudovibrio exalbescens TaxID=197461 RepID=UPI000C9B1D7E|nr:hypothetical protein [Pseudovibrio exalbescens]
MRVKVIANGIYDHNGRVAIGTVLNVQSIPKGWAGKVTVLDGGEDEEKTFATGQTPKGYEVKDKGRGWFVITKDGEEVTKSMRDDDVEGFDELTDEDKDAFVELNKKD